MKALLVVAGLFAAGDPPPLVPLPWLSPEPTATPTPVAEPAATPPPNQLPAQLALGRVRAAGGRLQLTLTARGGSLSDVRIFLRRGERTVRSVAVGRLSGTRRLTLAPRGGLTRGLYTVRVTVEGVIAADRAVTV